MSTAASKSAHTSAGPLLLVVGPGPLPDGLIGRVLREARDRAGTGAPLDLLMLRNDPDDGLAAAVRSTWSGQVVELNGSEYLSRIEVETRDSISRFVSELREQLTSIAQTTGGPRWARRFGGLWWQTQLSEKNSPADEVWWQLFRAAAVRLRLSERTYAACIVVGDPGLVDFSGQVARQAGVDFAATGLAGEKFNLVRILLSRAAGGLCYLFAIAAAKWTARRYRHLAPPETPEAVPPAVLYTWYPRVWTDRFGGWKDMYHGDLAEQMARRRGAEPVLALRIYDRTKFVTPATYMGRLRTLRDPERTPDRFVLLESFGRLWEALTRYVSPGDVLRYSRMTRHPDFGGAFVWEGIDAGPLLKRHLWRSVLVAWPHLQVLQSAAERLARRLRPGIVVLYCFEFVYGRAIIEGSREGAPETPIVGMQHGPITPMKMLYAGTPEERGPAGPGGRPLPEPDVYTVDGRIAADVLETRGIPPDRISVTGPPRFDDVWAHVRALRRSERGGPRAKTRVLVAPGLHDTPYVFGMATRALANEDGVEMVLKPHPKVSDRAVSRWVAASGAAEAGGGATVTVIRGGGIYEHMAQADIFLGTYSSASVEALAFRLPVILLMPNDVPDMSLFHGRLAPVLRASTAEELRAHVARLTSDPSFAAKYVLQITEVLTDAFGGTEVNASAALAERCTELEARPHPLAGAPMAPRNRAGDRA